jgi:hypothetical protein
VEVEVPTARWRVGVGVGVGLFWNPEAGNRKYQVPSAIKQAPLTSYLKALPSFLNPTPVAGARPRP